jgi:hypothetical protein
MRVVALVVLAIAALASASPLWDYVHKPDSNYMWHDTGVRLNNGTGSTWV